MSTLCFRDQALNRQKGMAEI
uniref:Uncharacterized protein n=1 Tax=Anguilla anguilla TaxID=7936 RepID=A0A0E9RT53_ANGAN